MVDEGFDHLIASWLSGETTADEEDRLAELLLSSEDVRLRFVELVDQEASLRVLAQSRAQAEKLRTQFDEQELLSTLNSSDGKVADQGKGSRRHKSSFRLAARWRRSSAWPWLVVAAGVVLVLGIVLLLDQSRSSTDRVVKGTDPVKSERHELIDENRPQAAAKGEKFPATEAPPPTSNRPADFRASEPARSEQAIESSPVPPLPAMPEPQPQKQIATKLTPESEIGRSKPAVTRPSSLEKEDTERPIARIVRLEGRVRYARGEMGKWADAVVGIRLFSGDRLDTRVAGMASLKMKDGAAVYVKRKTLLRLLEIQAGADKADLVSLEQGEVYVVDEGTRKVHVETSDGLLSPIGTRFDVMRTSSATVVTVEEGAIQARTRVIEKKPTKIDAAVSKSGQRHRAWSAHVVRVRPGEQSRLRRGRKPSKPRKVKISRIVSWVRGLQPQPIFHEGFERFSVPQKKGRNPVLILENTAGWLQGPFPGVTFSLEREDVHGGTQALRVRDRSTKDQGKFWKIFRDPQLVKLRGKRVRFSVSMKALGSPAREAYLAVDTTGQRRNITPLFTVEPTWKVYRIEFVLPLDFQGELMFTICSSGPTPTGEVLVDGVRLELLTP